MESKLFCHPVSVQTCLQVGGGRRSLSTAKRWYLQRQPMFLVVGFFGFFFFFALMTLMLFPVPEVNVVAVIQTQKLSFSFSERLAGMDKQSEVV